MKNITPLRDKVLGKMLEPPGTFHTTKAGIIIPETTVDERSVRPRWFLVTHIGPEQKYVKAGDYVLVQHGRWSRGVDIEGNRREEDKIFLLDNDEILIVSDDPEIS
jgi:co-chaperonin GroES (HSP10)